MQTSGSWPSLTQHGLALAALLSPRCSSRRQSGHLTRLLEVKSNRTTAAHADQDVRERYGDKNHLNAPKLAKTLEAK